MRIIPCCPAFICTGPLFSVCAQFQHQTRQDEHHALVTIVRVDATTPVNARISSLDGQPVREGGCCRVRPGKHQLVMEAVVREIESANPLTGTLYHTGNAQPDLQPSGNLHISKSGTVTATGVNPYQGMQSVSMSVENRTVRQQTREFTVVAGRKYVIDGAMILEDR
jgi:hypothetical protein